MATAMVERTRVIFDTEDVVKRAVRLRAAKGATSQTMSEVITAILKEALAEEIAEIQRHDSKRKKKGVEDREDEP